MAENIFTYNGRIPTYGGGNRIPYFNTVDFTSTYSMNLDGVNEYLKIDNVSNAIDTALRDSTPNFSISIWYKSTDTFGVLFQKYLDAAPAIGDRNQYIQIANTGHFQWVGIYDGTNIGVNKYSTGTDFADGTWKHIVCVYDYSQTTAATIAVVYVNGVEYTNWDTNTVSTTNKFFYNQTNSVYRSNVYMGFPPAPGADYLAANIGESTFWDKSLSSTEVTELYNSGCPYDVSLMTDYSTNCLAWWRMGNSTGDVWGANWTIENVNGTASTELTSVNMEEADRQTDSSC